SRRHCPLRQPPPRHPSAPQVPSTLTALPQPVAAAASPCALARSIPRCPASLPCSPWSISRWIPQEILWNANDHRNQQGGNRPVLLCGFLPLI
ncbi:Os09g0134900, partial [Oryza sativa Japonica Group]